MRRLCGIVLTIVSTLALAAGAAAHELDHPAPGGPELRPVPIGASAA
jgi:hypothetical protein